MKMTKPDIPDAMTAQTLEAACLGLRPFLDLGRFTLKTDHPRVYADACAAIESGTAQEIIICRFDVDAVLLSLCLLDPASPLPPAIFKIAGRAMSESVN